MVIRSLVKVVVAAGEALTKAFARAVREEIKASQQAAAHQASSSGNSRSASEEKEATKANARLGISLQESMQILDVKAPLNSEEVEKRFKHLFEVNEKTNGGSFYLQSKIYCSKQRIDEELRRQEQTKKED